MARLKNEIDMGGGYKLFLLIDDGIAIMSCNYANALKKIYMQGKQDETRDIIFDYRHNTMTEKFEGLTAEEIWNKLNYAISIAHRRQKEVIEKSKEKKEEEK